MTNLSLDNFNRMWIGFDQLHNQMNNLQRLNNVEYPRYNIIEDGDKYTLEMALPGWKKERYTYRSLHSRRSSTHCRQPV